jgi:ABC-type multidrug transport system ATPase subunit
MKRKMCVCMALIGDPKVLFLDEPTAGMDSGARRDVWKLLLRKRAGRCIVLCTHHMDEADILSDRIAVINEGKLQDVGTPTGLKHKYGKYIHLEISVGQGCNRHDVLASIDRALVDANNQKQNVEEEKEEETKGMETVTTQNNYVYEHGEGIVCLDMSDHVGDEAALKIIQKEMLDALDAADLRLLLPSDADVAVVMEALEKAVDDNESNVENYGIVAATLSDVFWELDQEAGRRAAALEEEEHRKNSGGTSSGNGGDNKEPTLEELVRETNEPHSCVKIMEIMKQRKVSLIRSAWGIPFPCGCRIPILVRETASICTMTLGLLISLVNFDVPLPSGNFVQMGYTEAFSHNNAGRMAVALDMGKAAAGAGDPTFWNYTAQTLVPSMTSLATTKVNEANQVPVPVDMTSSEPCMLASLIQIKGVNYCNNNMSGSLLWNWEDRESKESGEYISPTEGPGGYVAAIEFHSVQTTTLNTIEQHIPQEKPPDIEYVVRPNTSNLFALPGIVSFAHSALLSNVTGNANIGIAVNLDVLPTYADTEEAKTRLSLSIGLLMVQFRSLLFLMTGLSFTIVAANWVRQLVKQKETQVYQLQILMGIKPSEYLSSNMLFDFLHYLCLLVIPLVLVFAVDTPIAHSATVLLCVAHGVAMLPIMYLLSKLFEKPEPAYSFASALFMLMFLVTFLGYFVCAIPDIAQGIDVDNLDTIRYIVTLWPTTALALGFRAVLLSGTYQYNPLSVSVNATELGLNRDGQDISRYLFGEDLPIETAFVPIVVLFAEGLVFFAVAYMVDLGICGAKCAGLKVIVRCCRDCRRCACCGCCYGPEPTPFVLAGEDVEDEDVLHERDECSNMYKDEKDDEELGKNKTTPAVFLHQVHCKYPPSGKQRTKGTVAVHDLSLRIRPKECFSLLGTNGAGKTTTLQMIMRQVALTSGTIEIDGKNISAAADDKFAGMGFCPQKNALLPNHTTKEVLMFYARVRGIPTVELEEYVQQWMNMTRLTPFQNTRCKSLSGGNKRKLSLTIAIIGNPTLAVLDEPSAGVDPAARKKLHRVINAVKLKGTTIILTTHHMGEAAKMGDRIGIMVQGRLGCIGTAGHLLNVYSEGYVCNVSMTRGQNVEESVLPLLREKCPHLTIASHPNEQYISVRLGTRDSFSLVDVYKCLDERKNEGGISFFTVGQANLENIFLRFSALTDTMAAREKDDTMDGRGSQNGKGCRPLGHAHLLENNTETKVIADEDDGTWGHEWWESSSSRYVIRGDAKITGAGCLFGRYGGFSSQSPIREKEWAQEVPQRLRSRGVTKEEWERFIVGLEQAQRKTTACNFCRCIHCCFISLSVLTLSWGWLCMCCGWSKCDPYQIAMGKLLDKLNEDILKSKGMFAKILSFGGINDEGETAEKNVESFALPVLVFALTNKERRRLEAEQVLHKPEAEKKKNWNCWDCPAHAGRVL